MERLNNFSRIKTLSFFIFLAFIILVTKLYSVQIIHGDDFAEKADRQYTRPNENLFDRGSIFFKDKNGILVSAATLKSGYILAIKPNLIKEPEKVYEQLSKLVEIKKEDYFAKVDKKDDPYEEITEHLSQEVADRITKMEFEGVNVYKERWRFYPGNNLASNVVGFTAFQEDELAGRYGIENYYENVLSRQGKNIYTNFFAEIFSDIGDTLSSDGQKRKGDVITTIEPIVQGFLERKLYEVNQKWSSRTTMGAIINPKTGAIYAMAVYPSFDLNSFSDQKEASIFSNPMIENVFEMGSIIKPLTMSAGLDAGVVNSDTKYDDEGFLILDKAKISNYDGKGRGVVNMQEVLNQSLNTGVSFVVSKLGNKRFADYMKSFGIGEETGIDLPNESVGIIDNLDSPRDLEYATASFGQGIAISPIATIRAMSILANGGTLITPHVVEKVQYESGLSKTIRGETETRVLKKETSDEITRMLVEVVDKALLGGTVKMDKYNIAAKTGTAQIPDPVNGGYYEDRYLHSFFGYFPAYNPQFLIFLMTIEPKEVGFASHTLTQPFIDTTKFLINYYEIAPDR
ncbi:MAG: penicillin-binding protein 2 [Candidatus Paceibacterota bacterium]